MTASTPTARRRANRTFLVRFLAGVALYLAALILPGVLAGVGVPLWLPALLVLPGVGLMAWANIDMYRSGDEYQRRRVAEAVMLAFLLATPLILAVGVLQFLGLPALNWILAFSLLMLGWIVGTVVVAIRHR
ncbi:hypothetical protein GCM10028787_08750 [Brachybacterium horti]